MSGKEDYDKIAAEINEVVEEINARLAACTTRRENSKEEEQAVKN